VGVRGGAKHRSPSIFEKLNSQRYQKRYGYERYWRGLWIAALDQFKSVKDPWKLHSMQFCSANWSFFHSYKSYKKYAESSEAWDLNEDRIRELQVTIRIPFFRGINIVLPLSYRNSRYSASFAHTSYIVLPLGTLGSQKTCWENRCANESPMLRKWS
jgi:hypothetical protein